MSGMEGEKTLHVYRVTHVAEYHVENAGIYEDDVDMLRDVLAAARQGLLLFEPAEADFVAMIHGEDDHLDVRVIKVEGLGGAVPAKATGLPTPEPPPAQPRKPDEAPPRPARKPSRGRRRSS